MSLGKVKHQLLGAKSMSLLTEMKSFIWKSINRQTIGYSRIWKHYTS